VIYVLLEDNCYAQREIHAYTTILDIAIEWEKGTNHKRIRYYKEVFEC
jgi:hypothetical protein